jgi:S1-C subfamily serine protease
MDYAAIAAANKAAMTFLVVEMPDSARSSGTGFNLLPSGLIVTNRHVVQDSNGTRAQRIAVAFDGTRGQWLQATVEYISETDELALLRLVRPGAFPVVAGIAGGAAGATLGEPVGILGYPLGTSLVGMDGDINALRPTATLGFGTVSKVLDEALQLDAYAAQGSSGSPVFDARGLIVGIVYGGARESNGRIVYAVPAARLIQQLPKDASGVVR